MPLNIVIADIHFHISSGDIPLLRGDVRKTYAPFILDTVLSGPGAERIDVNIETTDFPDTGQLIKIFETPDSWSMYSDGEQYFWINIPPSPEGGPLCAASFQRRLEKATVYCRGPLINDVSGKTMITNPISYPLDQLLLMYALAGRDGACLHSSAVDLNGKGYLFPGRSGAGKSTISRSFASKNHAILSDDRIIVRKIGDSFMCFGTPWAGDAEIAENRGLPLHGIFFIIHGNENRLEKITPIEAFERLMPVTSIPWYDEKVMSDILSFCEDIVMNVPAYELHFKPDSEVVYFLEKFESA